MPRQRNAQVSDAQIVVEYEKLRSIPKVAEALAIGSTTVQRALKKSGVARTGLDEYRRSMGALKSEPYIGVYKGSKQQILDWYSSGLSMKAIASKIGRSVHVVARRVRAAGLSRPWGGSGHQHSMWAGGRNKAGDGYWKIWISQDDPMASMRGKAGYVKEHRLVLARKLGRPILDSETVHHIDGDKANNSPENLELRQGKHGKHVVMCCLDCGSRNIGHVGLNG